ncbi:MAG TPA: hypothetical protein VIS31_06985 [Woeseiaceae bacterium]
MFALLLQLFRELGQPFLATQTQSPELVEDNHVVDPLGIQQQVFKMIQLLLNPCRRTLMLLDAILQLVFFIAQGRERLLQFRAVAEQIKQLVRFESRLLRFAFEERRNARQCANLFT